MICLENHDQVANTLRGARLPTLTSPGRLRAMTALTLLAPGTPMLFQGQEFGSTRPFLYFADHDGELAKAVRDGPRRLPRPVSVAGDAGGQGSDPGSGVTGHVRALQAGSRARPIRRPSRCTAICWRSAAVRRRSRSSAPTACTGRCWARRRWRCVSGRRPGRPRRPPAARQPRDRRRSLPCPGAAAGAARPGGVEGALVQRGARLRRHRNREAGHRRRLGALRRVRAGPLPRRGGAMTAAASAGCARGVDPHPRPRRLAAGRRPRPAADARVDGHQRARRLRGGDAVRGADPTLAWPPHRVAAGAARAHLDADAAPGGASVRGRRDGLAPLAAAPGDPARERPPLLALGPPGRGAGALGRDALPAEHDLRQLPPAPRVAAGGADAGAGLRFPPARGTGRRRPRRLHHPRRAPGRRAAVARRALPAAPARAARPGHGRRAAAFHEPAAYARRHLRRRERPWLRQRGAALHPGRVRGFAARRGTRSRSSSRPSRGNGSKRWPPTRRGRSTTAGGCI